MSAAHTTINRSAGHAEALQTDRASLVTEPTSREALSHGTLHSFGRFVWAKRVWWIVPLAAAAAANAALHILTSAWSSGGPAGF